MVEVEGCQEDHGHVGWAWTAENEDNFKRQIHKNYKRVGGYAQSHAGWSEKAPNTEVM